MLDPAPVHAAEAARRHDGDAGLAAHGECSADRRRADAALNGGRGQVARAHLARGSAETVELLLGQPYPDRAVEDADRRRRRAARANASLRLEAHRDAFAGREPVRDECRLERDNGRRVTHFGCDLDQRCSSMFTNSTSPQRANVRTCRPVSRKPARS